MYQRERERAAAVNLVFRILNADLHDVTATERRLAANEFAVSGAAAARVPLPLETLTRGSYVLRVVATANGATSSRDLRFSVS